jgi:hypothetical protein
MNAHSYDWWSMYRLVVEGATYVPEQEAQADVAALPAIAAIGAVVIQIEPKDRMLPGVW